MKSIRSNFTLVVLLGLIFVLVPASLAQAATASVVTEADVSLENIAGKPSVIVKNLPVGAIVKVYDQNGKLLGSTIMKAGQTSADVSLSGLNSDVYVTVTLESDRKQISLAQTTTLTTGSSIIVNNAGMADTVTVTDLEVGDIVKVYKDATADSPLGSATVAKGKTEAIVSISQLSTEAGEVNVTLTSIGKKESDRCKVDYTEEVETVLAIQDIIVVNDAGTADKVTVTDLEAGDVVKVYNASTTSTGAKLLGKATVAKGKTEAVVTISQLGLNAGSVYVTLTNFGKIESIEVRQDYDAEPQTYQLEDHNITIVNNAGLADTVTAKDDVDNSILEVGDIVRVYNEVDKLLGKATAVKSKTDGEVVEAVVSIRQLGTDSGKVKVSVTAKGNTESVKVDAEYDEEKLSDEPSEAKIKVIDNSNTNDKVTVAGLKAGDIVKVYSANVGGKLLGKATAKGSTEAEAVVVIRKLGTGNEVWLTVTSNGMQESERVQKGYTALLVPAAIVSDIKFEDIDNDANQIAGVVSWKAPDDVSNVTLYEIYTSKEEGKKGAKLGEVAVGTETFTIPNNKRSTGVTHIAIYTKNLVGEAITGVYVPIIDTVIN